jgi:hypothetical protein
MQHTGAGAKFDSALRQLQPLRTDCALAPEASGFFSASLALLWPGVSGCRPFAPGPLIFSLRRSFAQQHPPIFVMQIVGEDHVRRGPGRRACGLA